MDKKEQISRKVSTIGTELNRLNGLYPESERLMDAYIEVCKFAWENRIEWELRVDEEEV